MLRISINRLILAHNSIENTWRFLIVNFPFLPKVDTSDPLMLNFLEWWFDFEYCCQLVKQIPKNLIFSIEIIIFGCLTDVIETFNFSVTLLYFKILVTFFVCLILFLLSLGICLFWWHKYNWLIFIVTYHILIW